MPTLNSIGDRIANMLGQPYNRELKERAKDMVKDLFANRIRQSVEKHGIDDQLKLSFVVAIESLDLKDVIGYDSYIQRSMDVLGTGNKIPVPIRISNDAPFMYVGSVDGDAYTYVSSPFECQYRSSLFPTGVGTNYCIVNNRLIIIKGTNNLNVIDKREINEVLVTGIWRDPDEVLSLYRNDEGQDLEIPFPADMFTNIIYEMLRTEFNVMPRDVDIQFNDDRPVQQNSRQ